MNLIKKNKLLSYHNDPEIKKHILAQLQAHFDADEIIKGIYWENGKGCAVGCTIHSSSHQEYETRFGIPTVLARLEDIFFENLPNKIAKPLPLRFMSAIPVGVDLCHVFSKWVLWVLTDPTHGVLRFVKKDSAQEKTILRVADQYQNKIADADVVDAYYTAAGAAVAYYAATAVAYYTAAATSASADADVAYYAATAVAYYATDAAGAAAAYYGTAAGGAYYAATASANVADAYYAAAVSAAAGARINHYQIMADKLIEIIQSIK